MRAPNPSPSTRAFWAAVAADRPEFPVCDSCGAWHDYPRPWCRECGHDGLTLRASTGGGVVVAGTDIYPLATGGPASEARDFTYLLVDLDDGFRLGAIGLGFDRGDGMIGSRVCLVTWRDPREDDTAGSILAFRPDDSQ